VTLERQARGSDPPKKRNARNGLLAPGINQIGQKTSSVERAEQRGAALSDGDRGFFRFKGVVKRRLYGRIETRITNLSRGFTCDVKFGVYGVLHVSWSQNGGCVGLWGPGLTVLSHCLFI
jgi:hypothetical protein